MEAFSKFFSKSGRYDILSQNEKIDQTCSFSFCHYHKQKFEKQEGQKRWRTVLTSTMILLLSIGVATMSAYLVLQRSLYSRVVAASEIKCNCGGSIAEAISIGCRYDPMSTSWLPPACRDDELIDQFNHAGPGPNGTWTYYATKTGDRPMTVEQVALLAEDPVLEARRFWATHEWHIQHCLFYWRKEFRVARSARLRLEAMKAGGFTRNHGKSHGGERVMVMENAYTFESHIAHCALILMHPRPKDEITNSAMVGLTSDYIETGEESKDQDI